jgi:hypothetical protein
MESVEYRAFVDPSGGGGQDSMALAIGHKSEEGRIVLDALLEKRPPFNVGSVTAEFAETLKGYGVSQVMGDKYGGEWPAQAFARQGVHYETAEKSSSELFLELLPALTSGGVEILDNKRLVSQLANLERRSRPGGRDLVAHFPGSHDDLAVVLAGLCSLEMRDLRKGKVYFRGMVGVVRSSSRRISGGFWDNPKVISDAEARSFRPGEPPFKPGLDEATMPAAAPKILDPTKGHVFVSHGAPEQLSSEWIRSMFSRTDPDVEPADKVPGEK